MLMGAQVLVAAWVVAGADPAALLGRVDAAANRAKDAVLTLHVEVSTRGSAPLERTLRVWQLGTERRMVKFIAPARLRGTGILVPRRGQTYLYLPASHRARRVVGNEGGGSFMGLGFSIDDLSRVRFSDDYVPSLHAETATHWTLKLVPRRPAEHRHAYLLIDVRKADELVESIRSFDAAGKGLRSMVASDFKKVGQYTVAHHIRIDELATGRRTDAKLTEVGFDTGLDEGDFTERQLERAP